MSTQPQPYAFPSGVLGLEPEPPTTSPVAPVEAAERPKFRPRRTTQDTAPVGTIAAVPAQAMPSGKRLPTSTWLPSRLASQVREEYESRGIGAGQLFKEAIEFGKDKIPGLLKKSKRRQQQTTEDSGGLFAAATPVPARPRAFDEPTETLTYRMSKADQQILDELVSKWGAISRGHLIGCALDHYFTHRPDKSKE